MEATVLKTQDAIKELNELIELDFDAIAAYDSAINRLQSAEYKRKLKEFKQDHRRHVTELSKFIRKLGGEAADSGDLKKILTQGKVVIANIVGDDKTILKAMKLNEDQTNLKYEKAVQEFGASEELAALLATNLEDERRHREWILSTLQSG
ncbi:MAG TPA: PA2169 family four-helix-bundle protein [Dongiaceae bacterium]|nr:PA2169 family four-helix-bundle protein [Dongiaceae bacterium]